MEPYKFPEHIPFDPQPDWITDTTHEDDDMTPETEKLFNDLMNQLGGVIDTLEQLKTNVNNENNTQSSTSDDEVNVLRMMLETEKERANAAEGKLKAVLGALNG